MILLLLGTIDAGPDSVALFGADGEAKAFRSGSYVSGFKVGEITRRGVVLHKEGKFWVVRPGDTVEDVIQTKVQITQGIEYDGNLIRVSSMLRDFVTKDGLVSVLNQACSEKVDQGYRIFEIDKGSAFDLAGFKDNDIVTSIDGVELTSPFTALKMLLRIKESDSFSYTRIRAGKPETMSVEVF